MLDDFMRGWVLMSVVGSSTPPTITLPLPTAGSTMGLSERGELGFMRRGWGAWLREAVVAVVVAVVVAAVGVLSAPLAAAARERGVPIESRSLHAQRIDMQCEYR